MVCGEDYDNKNDYDMSESTALKSPYHGKH